MLIPLQDQKKFQHAVHKLAQACANTERMKGTFTQEHAQSKLLTSMDQIDQFTDGPFTLQQMTDLMFAALNYSYLQRYDLATALIEKLDNESNTTR